MVIPSEIFLSLEPLIMHADMLFKNLFYKKCWGIVNIY